MTLAAVRLALPAPGGLHDLSMGTTFSVHVYSAGHDAGGGAEAAGAAGLCLSLIKFPPLSGSVMVIRDLQGVTLVAVQERLALPAFAAAVRPCCSFFMNIT